MKKVQITIDVDEDVALELKAAVIAAGKTSVYGKRRATKALVVTNGIRSEVVHLRRKINQGRAFRARPGAEIQTGRPPKIEQEG